MAGGEAAWRSVTRHGMIATNVGCVFGHAMAFEHHVFAASERVQGRETFTRVNRIERGTARVRFPEP